MKTLNKIESLFLNMARTTSVIGVLSIIWAYFTEDIELYDNILDGAVLLLIVTTSALLISTLLKMPSFFNKG